MTAWLPAANLAFAVLAVAAPVAHVLELPNKLPLEGELWLAVQQNLYRGWGPFLGAPTEIGALVTSLLLAVMSRGRRAPLVVACLCYAGMIATFFALNAPVNAAVAAWTPTTLPADWGSYRARWETGHALAALLAIVGLAAVLLDRRGRASDFSRVR